MAISSSVLWGGGQGHAGEAAGSRPSGPPELRRGADPPDPTADPLDPAASPKAAHPPWQVGFPRDAARRDLPLLPRAKARLPSITAPRSLGPAFSKELISRRMRAAADCYTGIMHVFMFLAGRESPCIMGKTLRKLARRLGKIITVSDQTENTRRVFTSYLFLGN